MLKRPMIRGSVVLGMFAWLVACSEPPTAGLTEADIEAAKGGNGGGGGPPSGAVFQVVFADRPGDRLTGDGAPYVDGADKVSISVTQSAVTIRPNTAKRGGTRSIFLDFGDAVLIHGDADLQDGSAVLSEIPPNPSPFGPDPVEFSGGGALVIEIDVEAMTVGATSTAQAQLTWTPVDRLHKLRFGRFFQDVDGDGEPELATEEGDLVTVTRTSGTTWTVASAATDIAILKDDDAGPSAIVGGYFMPFELTLTKN